MSRERLRRGSPARCALHWSIEIASGHEPANVRNAARHSTNRPLLQQGALEVRDYPPGVPEFGCLRARGRGRIPRPMGHTKLHIPGPVEVSEKTFRAFCSPMIGHRGQGFKDLYAKIQPQLQQLLCHQAIGLYQHVLGVGRDGGGDSQSRLPQGAQLHVRRVLGQVVRCLQALRQASRGPASALGLAHPRCRGGQAARDRPVRRAHGDSQRDLDRA